MHVIPGVELVHTRNTGVAFGALSGGGAIVTVVVGIALVALLGYFATHVQRPLFWLPTGMLVGGAIGNVIDRLRAGEVTDFVQIPLGFPAFNVADMSITLRRHRPPLRHRARCGCTRPLRTPASASTRSSPARSARGRRPSG